MKLKENEVPSLSLDEKITVALEKNSDFAFEMDVLHKMVELGFECQHSGTYVDPIKARNREFDIRGIKLFDDVTRLHVAVECKNTSMSPLIIHRVPRRLNEAFHNVLVKPENDAVVVSTGVAEYTTTYPIKLEQGNTPYQPDGYVGKAMDQAVQDGKNGIKLSDSEVFDKFSQALNSLSDLVESVARRPQAAGRHALLAILIVPDGSLWTIDYSDRGIGNGKPKPATHVQYFVNRIYPFESYPSRTQFALTHLEIVTPSELGGWLSRYCTHFVNYAPLFPQSLK